MPTHNEALTDVGKLLFPRLSRFRGCYLAGGAALALQIGHRVSGVKVTFLHYPFPRQLPLVSLGNMRALSVKEIGATKAYTISRRGELKDYVDLYFILKNRLATLDEVSSLAQRKYDDGFEPRLIFEQFLHWDDLDLIPITFLNEAPTRKSVETFFAGAFRIEVSDA